MEIKIVITAILIFISSISFAQHGYYRGGHGSSHKRGHYVNRHTSNHYRTRRHRL